WRIGDTVTLNTGDRYINENNDTYLITGGYQKGEYFVGSSQDSYIITAILKDNPSTVNTPYPIIKCIDYSKHQLDNNSIKALVELKEVSYKSLDELRDIVKQYKIEEYNFATDYLETQFAFEKGGTVATVVLPMASIVLAIIIIASVVLIYNAFAMSISERVRYLGMLSSVGATKKQKQFSVFFEGAVLGLIGIPVGILSGIAGIGITLTLLGDDIISTGMIRGANADNLKMNIVVEPLSIIAIVLVSILTIFISSLIPAIKASGITPIDAIRQNSEIKVKAKRLKSSKLIRLIFGYEGELANKNLKRNGRKARTITASIALSVILFLSCNYFCDAFSKSILTETDVPYQIYVGVEYEDREKITKDLESIAGVDDAFCVSNGYYRTPTAENSSWSIINEKYLTPTYKGYFNSSHSMSIFALDDEDFNKMCDDNSINAKDYYGSYKVILMNNVNHNQSGAEVFRDSIVGVDMSDFTYKGLTVGDLIKYDKDFYACNLAPKNTISMYMPVSQYQKMCNEEADSDRGFTYILGLVTSDHKAVFEEVQKYFDEGDSEAILCTDMLEQAQTLNTIEMVMQVLIYGFIALISLITIFNIINTISTGIAMRKKEFAMLKSVGTTPKGFNKMIALESAFYGIKALLFGLPISAAISFAMNKSMDIDSLPFEINWLLYLAVALVVFAIIGLSMLYSFAKLKNDSIVETLKQEIN
ncbi:ABC transporter permease, partial [Eubacterium sp.]|uniref:ABC transporter permease n=1 Tax=Eubacterium sp. TaxID=142586 RepID=UPI003F012F41